MRDTLLAKFVAAGMPKQPNKCDVGHIAALRFSIQYFPSTVERVALKTKATRID